MLYLHANWTTAVFAAFALAVAIHSFLRRWRSTRSRGFWFLLSETARVFAVLMVCLAFLKIEWGVEKRLTLKPEIIVLTDVSDSMKTVDVIRREADGSRSAVSRARWAARHVTDDFFGKLRGRFKIERKTFSLPPGKAGAVKTNGTDVRYALESVLKRDGNTRAVVLVSDGDWNAGGSPVGAAAELRARGIKVFPIGTGSPTWLPDLELLKVKAPAFCLANEKVAIPFVVNNRLGRLVSTEISLKSNGAPAATKKLEIPARGSIQETMVWKPGKAGAYDITLSIPVQDGEAIPDNNSFSFKIEVRDEKLKVLVIDSLPRWEYRYLRNALMRDPGVEERSLLYLPKIGYGGGAGYLKRFPSKKLLSTFDVVFLGDVFVGKDGLTPREADMLAELVEQQGSGLVFLPGRRGAIYSYSKMKLADLCPVELDPKGVKGYRSGVESTMSLTGVGRSHFLLMLADNPELNDYVWRRLPGFFWNAKVLGPKPGSQVLAVHSGLKCASGRMPLIVIAERGNGNVLFMGFDSAWRWRKGVEDKYHYRFWGQVVRWMAHKRHLAGDSGIRCFFVPETPVVGRRATLFATIHDRSGATLDGVPVTACIRSPRGGGDLRIDLRQEKKGWGLYKGEFTPSHPGETTVELRCEDANAELTFKMHVRDVSDERVGTPAKFASLKELAGITRGVFHDTADFGKLIDELNGLPKRKPLKTVSRIWCAWWWGAAIVLLLAVHWAVRKLRGEL